MATKATAVEIYTVSHRILGRIQAGATGLFAFLNLPTASSVQIDGATLTRLHQPGRMVARYPRMWLMKAEIVALLLSNRGELGPTTMVRSGYSTTKPHWIHILAGGYEMRGSIETPGEFNFEALMAPSDRLFSPLYKGELQAILFPDIHAEFPALMFNREKVDAIALLPRDEIPGASEDASP